MHFLLFGRGVAGVGAGGLFVCVFASVAQVSISQASLSEFLLLLLTSFIDSTS